MMLALAILTFLCALATFALLAQLLRRTSAQVGPGANGASLDRVERTVREEIARNRQDASTGARELRDEVSRNLKGATDSLVQAVAGLSQVQSDQLAGFSKRLVDTGTATEGRLESVRRAMDDRLTQFQQSTAQALHDMRVAAEGSSKVGRQELGTQLGQLAELSERKQTELRQAVEGKLGQIQTENALKLEEMRKTVDEKLQSTLETRLGHSFRQVSERLEQVHKGLGEMQTLAHGVGDLKRVLTNVKTRGTWGEVQLGNLLEQVLSPDQYAKNVSTRPGSADRVEFAIRLPGPERKQDSCVWLPIDAKFPVEDYARLLQAVDNGDSAGVESASRALEARLQSEAQTIRSKYIDPPHTTDFALLFLPMEGLYAEALRRPGLVERLQNEHRIVVAGPTTLAALLNALSLGFQTLAIEQRTSEIWQVLGAVKTEFSKFGTSIEKVQKKLQEASKAVDDAAVRSRAMDRRLRSVEELPANQAAALLGSTDDDCTAVGAGEAA